MLAHNIEIADIDGRHWAGWYELLMPPRIRAGAPWALLIVDKGRLVKALVRGRGAVALATVPFSGPDRAELARVAKTLGVSAVVVLERAVLTEIFAEIELELDAGADFVAQALVIVRALKRRSGEGIWTEPDILELVPPVTYDSLQRTFELLVADKTSLVVYAFDAQGIVASLIAVKRRGHIDFVTTHQGVDDAVDGHALARGWRREYKRLLPVIGERYGAPGLGIFFDRQAFHRLATGPSEQLARELKTRSIIIDPAPAWLLGLLGGATVAALAGRSAKALSMLLPSPARQMAKTMTKTMTENLAQTVMRGPGASPFALLGFDPIELWSRVRHLYQNNE